MRKNSSTVRYIVHIGVDIEQWTCLFSFVSTLQLAHTSHHHVTGAPQKCSNGREIKSEKAWQPNRIATGD
jgi:hypothetical protein